MSVNQIRDLFFSSIKVARRRLLILYELGVADRFERPLTRNGPNYYVLDHLGARVVAARRGIAFRELGWHKEDTEALPFRDEFNHLVEVNEFFVRLHAACRQEGGHRVKEWWGELHCFRAWAETVYPDGYAYLEGPGGTIEVFLELDRGTEGPSRLEGKLVRYEEVAQLEDCPAALLFSFPDPEREVAARRRLYNPGITVATTVYDLANADPLGAVWLPIGSQQRVRLLHLPKFRKDDRNT